MSSGGLSLPMASLPRRSCPGSKVRPSWVQTLPAALCWGDSSQCHLVTRIPGWGRGAPVPLTGHGPGCLLSRPEGGRRLPKHPVASSVTSRRSPVEEDTALLMPQRSRCPRGLQTPEAASHSPWAQWAWVGSRRSALEARQCLPARARARGRKLEPTGPGLAQPPAAHRGALSVGSSRGQGGAKAGHVPLWRRAQGVGRVLPGSPGSRASRLGARGLWPVHHVAGRHLLCAWFLLAAPSGGDQPGPGHTP